MNKKDYTPPKKILENYANVLVNFALGSGKGIRKGEVVHLIAEEFAKPLYLEIRKAIWKAGGHVLSDYRPANEKGLNIEQDFYLHTENHQLEFFPHHYLEGLVKQVDHQIFILGETDLSALKNIDPKKIMARGKVFKPYMEWRTKKENAGKFTWNLALYGTEEMAKEAKMTIKEYWGQIIKACFLDHKDPIAKWNEVFKNIEDYRKKLNKLPIDKFHVKGPDVDLWVKLGEKRQWAGGSGRNMPSFELYTSPDWRGTEGWIRFNQPLYSHGNMIEGIELTFKHGKIIRSKAKKNEKLLKQMIATEGANKIGEFSMTDRRFSRITKFMADTLFDENIGGPNGNTHIAIGNSYHNCYTGNPDKVSKKTWEKLGFNNSSVHTDIITTTPRVITAYMKDGKPKVIYQNGEYCF
jgi:aminopeptidase